MFKTRVAILGALALLIVSGIATSTASATGPFWHVNGPKLRQGEVRQIKLQAKGTIVFFLTFLTTEVEIECRNSVSEGATIENSNINGQDKGRITFSSCRTLRPTTAACEVKSPITTNQTKSYLAINPNNKQQKFVDVFVPQQERTFAVLKFAGLCLGAIEEARIEGSVAAEIIPVERESQEGLLNFPRETISRVVYQQQEQTLGLTFLSAPFKFEASYGGRLATNEPWGVFGQ